VGKVKELGLWVKVEQKTELHGSRRFDRRVLKVSNSWNWLASAVISGVAADLAESVPKHRQPNCAPCTLFFDPRTEISLSSDRYRSE
jgi:hypothetical protein